MNESDKKRELESLKQRHKSIEQQLASLAGQIERFEAGGALENVVDRKRGY